MNVPCVFYIKKSQPNCVVKIPIPERGCSFMARRKGMMSDQLKEEIAKELGFYDTVQKEGWGGIRARDAGNMVKRAIEMAEQSIEEKDKP
jgi:small acid-soluble spore protein F (minor alpha/beta-type SASP)